MMKMALSQNVSAFIPVFHVSCGEGSFHRRNRYGGTIPLPTVNLMARDGTQSIWVSKNSVDGAYPFTSTSNCLFIFVTVMKSTGWLA